MRADMFQVMAALEAGAGTATEILEVLRGRGRPGGEPTVPTLYRRLKECLDRGWVEIEVRSGGGSGPGRPGQRYRLTREGKRAVRAEAERWRGFVEPLLGPKEGG